MHTLFAWLGNTDIRAAEGGTEEVGPILMGLKTGNYQRLVLLSDFEASKVERYLTWLKSKHTCDVHVEHASLRGPTNYHDIYLAADKAVSAELSKPGKHQITFHLSPGTPSMAAVWVLLAKGKYGASLIESSKQQGVVPVEVPFELAAEFLPAASRSADEALAQLVQGLPPAAPEFKHIIHRCAAMKKLVARAQILALREVPVLIQGESGTGKELFARAIHASSRRKGKPFVAVNCGAIPAELVDAELFGYEKGAFTGASKDRAGHFESADGGTLFLDEIGELPLQSQVRLLRVLQEREVTPVGSSKAKKVDVRIITATNRILPKEVSAGRFREDVFHRIAVGILSLPPLRGREGDLSLLIDHVLDDLNQEASEQPAFIRKKISAGARKILLRHTWPGNVRELRNAILRASLWATGEEISAVDVNEALAVTLWRANDSVLGKALGDGFSLEEVMASVASHYLQRALDQAGGNKTEAAKLVGVNSPQTFSNWWKKYVGNGGGTNFA